MKQKKLLLLIMGILLVLICLTEALNIFFPKQDQISVRYFKEDFGNQVEDFIDNLVDYSSSADESKLKKAKKEGTDLIIAADTFNACQSSEDKVYFQYQWLKKEVTEISEDIDKAYTLAANKDKNYEKSINQIKSLRKSIERDSKEIDNELNRDTSFYFLMLIMVVGLYIYKYKNIHC